jgi:tetratricopeptide (TPR) repeat protein
MPINRRTALIVLPIAMLLPHRPLRADEALVRYQTAKGKAAIAAGKYRAAAESFTLALGEQPADPALRYYLAVALNRGGEHAKAIGLLEELKARAPLMATAEYELGLAFLGEGEYPRARAALARAAGEFPDDPLVCLYLGVAEGALGNTPESEKCFARARELDPSLAAESYIREGLESLNRGEMDQALETFAQASKYRAGPELQEATEALMAYAERGKGPRKKFSIDLMTGYEYDDNVTLMPEGVPVIAPQGRKDWRYFTDVRTAFTLVDTGRFRLTPFYDFYGGFNNRIRSYNLTDQSFGSHLAYRLNILEPYLLYRYDYYLLGTGQDSFLRSEDFEAGATLYAGRNTLARVRYAYTLERYFLTIVDPEDDRSGHDNLLGVDGYRFFFRQSSFIRAGFSYDRNDATGDNWTYNGYRFTGGLFFPLPAECRFNFDAELYLRGFPRNVDNRRDREQIYSFRIARNLGEHLEAGFQYMTIFDHSNVALYKYDRNLYTMFLAAHY